MATDQIRKWASEAFNDNNDGWTKQHYRNKLNEILDYLNILSLDEKIDLEKEQTIEEVATKDRKRWGG